MDSNCQDWFIECADKKKIQPFIDGYKSICKNDEDRFTLMELILGSFEILTEEDGFEVYIWKQISEILKQNKKIHQDTINYWSLEGENDKEAFFNLTEIMRGI